MSNRIVFAASEVQPRAAATEPFRVVLVHLRNNEVSPWVTWCQHPEKKHTYWGHYHRRVEDAHKEYLERCAKYDLDPTHTVWLYGVDLTDALIGPFVGELAAEEWRDAYDELIEEIYGMPGTPNMLKTLREAMYLAVGGCQNIWTPEQVWRFAREDANVEVK